MRVTGGWWWDPTGTVVLASIRLYSTVATIGELVDSFRLRPQLGSADAEADPIDQEQ
jgi:hypothetical protein